MVRLRRELETARDGRISLTDPDARAMATRAYSDEAGHAFRSEAGHLFQFHSGRDSNLKPATFSV